MIYVALLEAVAVVVVALTFAKVAHWQMREHARERTLMLNQLLHLAGRTWEPPPAADAQPTDEPIDSLEALLPEWAD